VATPNKITIRVLPSSKKQTVSVRTTGQWGKVNLSGVTLNLNGLPLTVPTDAGEYWSAILNIVLANLPT